MKLQKMIARCLLAALFSVSMAAGAFAGTWTNLSPEGQQTGARYYIGDSGQYVRSSWVQVDNVWYWLMSDGRLPNAYGISDDGYIFNEQGIYVPSVTGNAYEVIKAAPGGGSTVQAVSQHEASWTGYQNPRRDDYYRDRQYRDSYRDDYRPSDYGPGAGGVSDPHR